MGNMATENAAGNRIEQLLDAGSFVEIGGAVTARTTDFNMQEKKTPADGVCITDQFDKYEGHKQGRKKIKSAVLIRSDAEGNPRVPETKRAGWKLYCDERHSKIHGRSGKAVSCLAGCYGSCGRNGRD